jgi:hypothetical protein
MAVLGFTASVGAANAGVINFEEFGTKTCCFATEAPLDTQYSAIGVTFSGGWEILNQSGNFGISARSGQHFAAYNTDISGVTNTITLAFDSAITQANGFLGDDHQSSWLVTALLDGNQVSQLNLVNPSANYVEFSFNSLVFNQITIQGSGSSAVLDDISFGAVHVPEPSSIVLLALGLVGLSFSRRKKV